MTHRTCHVRLLLVLQPPSDAPLVEVVLACERAESTSLREVIETDGARVLLELRRGRVVLLELHDLVEELRLQAESLLAVEFASDPAESTVCTREATHTQLADAVGEIGSRSTSPASARSVATATDCVEDQQQTHETQGLREHSRALAYHDVPPPPHLGVCGEEERDRGSAAAEGEDGRGVSDRVRARVDEEVVVVDGVHGERRHSPHDEHRVLGILCERESVCGRGLEDTRRLGAGDRQLPREDRSLRHPTQVGEVEEEGVARSLLHGSQERGRWRSGDVEVGVVVLRDRVLPDHAASGHAGIDWESTCDDGLLAHGRTGGVLPATDDCVVAEVGVCAGGAVGEAWLGDGWEGKTDEGETRDDEGIGGVSGGGGVEDEEVVVFQLHSLDTWEGEGAEDSEGGESESEDVVASSEEDSIGVGLGIEGGEEVDVGRDGCGRESEESEESVEGECGLAVVSRLSGGVGIEEGGGIAESVDGSSPVGVDDEELVVG